MNALFLTQSRSLDMFYDLMQALRLPVGLERVGFLVADWGYYRGFRQRHPEIESSEFHVLKEWEFVQRARSGKPNLERLRAYERALGDPTLWGALMADRRVTLGPLCTIRQDYRLRFNHDQMLRILEEGLASMEKLFDEIRPDVVFSFICVTLGEYLAYLNARSRGIPFLNLRPTYIDNYVTFAPTIFEPSEFILAAYEKERTRRDGDKVILEARQYISVVRSGIAKYEGVLPVSSKAPQGKPIREKFIQRVLRLVQDEYDYHFTGLKDDNHIVDPILVTIYQRLLNPWRARKINMLLGRSYITANDLPSLDYVFVPLHTEPEISLLVQSRPFLNQIEVIRNISHSLPVGWLTLVKEHPASVGKRPFSYYRKMVQIPNVRLVDPSMNSKAVVEHAHLVATIAGSIGFEALIRAKPVITFGNSHYDMLPRTMVRRVDALSRLEQELNDLLAHYAYDEHAMVSFLAATIRQSEQVNLYSGLLGREDVYVPDPGAEEQTDIERLAALAVHTLAERVSRA